MTVYHPDERRLVLRLLAYWQDLRGDRPFPTPDEIDPAIIGDDWRSCILVELSDHPNGPVFRHLGDELAVPGFDATGRPIESCPAPSLARAAMTYMDKVTDRRVPISMGGSLDLDDGALLHRSIVMPLSSDGETIDFLLAAASAKTVDVAAADD